MEVQGFKSLSRAASPTIFPVVRTLSGESVHFSNPCSRPAAFAIADASLRSAIPGMRGSTSLSSMISSIPRRFLPLGIVLVIVALLPASVVASSYGTLVVRHTAPPGSTLETQFSGVRPPCSFLLVITEPANTQLQFKWSVHCFNAARRESGGASGEVTVTSGHWVKRVRANWIKHPARCSGSVVGAAASSPVLVRVFAD